MPPAKAATCALFTLLALTLVVGQEPTPCEVADGEECPIAQVCAPVGAEAGVCVLPPVSGVLLSTDATEFPLPVAYFPLTNGSAASWPDAKFNGTVNGAVWRQDHEFGSAMHCLENARDVVELDPVPFGLDGAFTVNLWIKKSPTSSFVGQFQFLLSIASSRDGETLDPSQPNQIHLFLPEEGTDSAGVLRAIVQDNNDDVVFHLDSSGLLNSTSPPDLNRGGVDLTDGEWHMVTLTSLPDGKRGFRLFLDGEMVAEAKGEEVSGGDALMLEGPLHLCGRADKNPERHFDGSIAKLSIFEEALRKTQIETMFLAVRQSTIARQLTSSEELDVGNSKSIVTLFADQEMAVRYVRGPEPDPTLLGRSDNVNATSPRNTFSLTRFLNKAERCPTSPAIFGRELSEFCQEEEVCVRVHGDLASLLHQSAEGNDEPPFDGICSTLPEGGSVWKGEDSGIPAPLAYFPMTGGDLTAWPVPSAQGREVAAELVEDPLFGQVYECDQRKRSFLILDNVAYGEAGHFAMNLWFKPSDLKGESFQYLFSHQGILPAENNWFENQIQVFLTEEDSRAPGLVRAIVKDSNDKEDAPQGIIFLDSDGDVALIENKDPQRTERERKVDIRDGEWHMLTLSTRVDLKKGFSMYLDGELVGEVSGEVVYTGDDGVPRSATGGESLRPGGKVYLCGRADGDPKRHFSGRLAEVMFFDQPLQENQILDLYQAAMQTESGRDRRKLLQQEPAALDPQTLDETVIEDLLPGSWWGRFIGEPGEEFGLCTGDYVPEGVNRTDLELCQEDLSCLPVFATTENDDFELTGICARFPSGGAYVFQSQNDVEVPIGYFPLKDGDLNSFPFPTFQGLASESLVFVEDDVLGSVMDCSLMTEDVAMLSSVPYPAPSTGSFSVAFWMRRREHHLGNHTGYETLFSHIGNLDRHTGLASPNQIQILLKTEDSASSFLQVIVRDENDEDEEFFSVDVKDVNVTDDSWHMIAVTSHANARNGFMVYVDGAQVGEAEGREATGGDVMKLETDIFLCGAADGSNDHHFDGNLAHLMLWNVVLSEQELLALYERLLLSSQDVQIAHPLRETVDGEPCLFPAVLNGEPVIDCTPLDGALKCPVRNGSWFECAEFEEMEEEPAIQAAPAVVRVTVDGEPCLTPGQLGRREVFGCVDFEGLFRCEFRRGQWKECSPQVKLRYTTAGAPCVFPFTYQGIQYSDCVETDVREGICQIANGEFEECAPAVFEGAVERPEAPERPTLLVPSVPSRLTVDGEVCQFPWMFENLSVATCVDFNGSPTCQTVNGTTAPCTPAVYTVDQMPCVFPFPHQNSMETSCIQREGALMCRVADGSWGVCGDDRIPIPPNDAIPVLPGRVTVDNESCAFPFWFEVVSTQDLPRMGFWLA